LANAASRPSAEFWRGTAKSTSLDIALDLYSTGESLAVTRTPAGTIGVDICADNFPDSLVPGHALARLHEITVIGVSNVGWLTDGPWKGRKCIGCSLAVGPGGEVLAQGPYGEDAEALIVVPVELRERRAYSR